MFPPVAALLPGTQPLRNGTPGPLAGSYVRRLTGVDGENS